MKSENKRTSPNNLTKPKLTILTLVKKSIPEYKGILLRQNLFYEVKQIICV